MQGMDADSRKDHGGAGGPTAHAHAAAAGHKAGEAAAASPTPGSTAVSAPAADASVTFGLPFVLNYWKELDLETARVGMDEQGLKIAEHQETSTRNRRKLAESTRDFRKASAAEQPKLFVGLLKAYQEEVDNLTKRAKFAESAFLGLYQKLYEAPDPVPALASAAEAAAKASELLAENRKLSTELDEFRAESSHLKNQQATVRRLEERNRQLEQQMEEKVKEMVAMKQQVLAEESQRSLEVLKEREDALQEQLRAAKASLESMQRLHEMGQSQLFEVRAKSEEERAAKQYELNLLTDEIERAQSRLLTLEREKDTLKAKLTDANEVDIQGEALNSTSSADADGSNSAGGGGSSGWEAALRAKEAVVSELHAELHAVESRAADAREAHLAEVKRLHALVQSKDDTIAELLTELSVRPSAKQWEDLRKQVKILQAVGYNAVEVDDWEAPTNGSTGANGSGAGTSSREKGASGGGGGDMGRLEALLLEKNRKMEHELTQAKVQLAERTKERDCLQEKADELEAQLAEHKSLVAKLEDDIVKGYNRGSGSSLDVSSATGRRGSGPADAAKVAAAAGAGTEVSGDGRGSDSGANTGGGSEEENVVLAVVCGQRDRFRQRIVDLEEELTQCKDKCGRAAAEVERLKADNVKLYERIRYVQDYTSSSSSGTANRSARKSAQDPEAVDVELKYKKMYEDGLNPFAQFSTKEREQRVRDLGLRDRITLTGGKFLLSNKHARTFVFFYSIALHVLVFFAMYRLSTFSHYYKTAKYSTSNVVASAGAWSGAPSNHTVAAMVDDDDDRLPSL